MREDTPVEDSNDGNLVAQLLKENEQLNHQVQKLQNENETIRVKLEKSQAELRTKIKCLEGLEVELLRQRKPDPSAVYSAPSAPSVMDARLEEVATFISPALSEGVLLGLKDNIPAYVNWDDIFFFPPSRRTIVLLKALRDLNALDQLEPALEKSGNVIALRCLRGSGGFAPGEKERHLQEEKERQRQHLADQERDRQRQFRADQERQRQFRADHERQRRQELEAKQRREKTEHIENEKRRFEQEEYLRKIRAEAEAQRRSAEKYRLEAEQQRAEAKKLEDTRQETGQLEVLRLEREKEIKRLEEARRRLDNSGVLDGPVQASAVVPLTPAPTGIKESLLERFEYLSANAKSMKEPTQFNLAQLGADFVSKSLLVGEDLDVLKSYFPNILWANVTWKPPSQRVECVLERLYVHGTLDQFVKALIETKNNAALEVLLYHHSAPLFF